MLRNYAFTLVVLSLLVMGQAVTARAADSCQPVYDALTKAATTPSHSYTTSVAANGSKTESETIIANGQKYIRVRGKWMSIPITSQDMLEQEKEEEQHGKSTCRLLRSEPVNGEAATLYSIHREYEQITEDEQIWISRGSGLPLRAEADIDPRGNHMKEHSSTRLEYGNVKPPM